MNRRSASILAVVLGLHVAPAPTTAQEVPDERRIRALRADFNAAIARHDLAAIAAFLEPGFRVSTSSGEFRNSAQEMLDAFSSRFTQTPDATYVRTPSTIDVSGNGLLAFESGQWVGTWTEVAGPYRMTGRYSAYWRKQDGRWRLHAELYVPLGCEGSGCGAADRRTRSGNPIVAGWYADPEAHVFDGEYWIYPTYSAPYDRQVHMDAFSSKDLLTWTRHDRVLDTANVKWAKRAVWAPSVIEKDDWYYLFFGANDIQSDRERGGIGVARSRSPGGPFIDHLGKPLIDAFHNGAQPIDQMVFRDADGSYYIVYGGWRHCNIAKLNADFTGFVPFPDGSTFKEITPAGYVEGAYMLVKDGKYYFMWSEGGWTGPDYAVAYAVGSSPFGPFERVGKILQQDPTVATGAGHHSVLHAPGSSRWYIVYHRRPLGESDRNHRVVSIDELRFDARGFIEPVIITTTGVAPDTLRAARRP